MFEILKQSYPFNNNFKHNMKTIGIVTTAFILIVLYFQPFGINFLASEHNGYFVLGAGILCAVVLFFNTLVLPDMLPRLFDSEKWTIFKELIWNLWMFLSLFFLFVFAAWLCMVTDFAQLPAIRTGALALLPIVLFNLINYNSSLKKKVSRAIDTKIAWFNEESKAVFPPRKLIKFESANKNDSFEEEADSILMIHSSSNYIEIYSRKKEEIKMRLLRNSLADIESLLKRYPEFKKCHRCWVVNLNQMDSFSGTPNGYSFKVKGCDLKVPVSRRYVSSMKKNFY
jgi:hypothetical protein